MANIYIYLQEWLSMVCHILQTWLSMVWLIKYGQESVSSKTLEMVAQVFFLLFPLDKAPFPAHAHASKGAWRVCSIPCRSRCQLRISWRRSSAESGPSGPSPAPGSYISGAFLGVKMLEKCWTNGGNMLDIVIVNIQTPRLYAAWKL